MTGRLEIWGKFHSKRPGRASDDVTINPLSEEVVERPGRASDDVTINLLSEEVKLREDYQQYSRQVGKVLDPDGRRTAKLSVTPYIYDRHLWERMERITSAYGNLLEFVFRQYPVDAKIQEVLAYPSQLEAFLGELNIYPQNLASARIDIFETGSGGLKMVESNCEIPGGAEESYYLEEEYIGAMVPDNLEMVPRMEMVYQTLMHYYQIQAEFFGLPAKRKLVIYLAQWQAEIDRIRGEYEILMEYLRRRGHICEVVDPNEITITSDVAVAPDGRRIDLIYRRFTADELPRFAEKSWRMAIEWDRAQVAVVNPFCTKRVDSKNIMVLFKDENYDEVFPPELAQDLATVRAIIPWTRKIEEWIVTSSGSLVEARPYMLANKDELVIKHANAYSSSAVFLGVDMEHAKWREVVEKSLAGDWIVQEKIELPEVDIEYWEDNRLKTARCIYNICPYIYDGKLGGFLCRASTDKLTSFKSGEIASILPCFMKVD